MLHFRNLAALLLMSLLVACGDVPTEVEDKNPVGSLSFDYSGTRSGSYSVSGGVTLDANGRPKMEDRAIAIYTPNASTPSDTMLTVGAIDLKGNSTLDNVAFLFFQKPTTGSFSLTDVETCAGSASPSLEGCLLAGLFFDIPLAGNPDPRNQYLFTEGTITLTRVDQKWVEGTFRGTASRRDPETGEVSGTVNVTNGKFRTPVVEMPKEEMPTFSVSPLIP